MNDVRKKPGEASQYISINYPVSQSYIYQTPLVHDSPASTAKSSIENLVPQTQYNTSEKPSVMLYTYIINRHAGIPDKNKNKTIV